MKVPRNAEEALSPERGLPMILLHTPKCGGSFAAAPFKERFYQCPTLTWPEAAGHKTFQEYDQIFRDRGDSLANYVVFTVIRNPWDWHLSWYNYVSKDEGGLKSGMPLEHEQLKNRTFSDYVRWLGDETVPRPPVGNDYTRRQVSDWIIDGNGDIAVSTILRQERLEEDLTTLKEKFDLAIDIPYGKRINSSRDDREYRSAYDDDTAEIIAKRHTRDIALFGYAFD